MMAAVMAATGGADVTLIEKNEKLGKKLYITGKGRCNVTNSRDISEFFPMVQRNSKFLYSSFYGFDNNMFCSFFEDNGLKLKVERGQRVFPQSDKSNDIIRCFVDRLRSLGVDIRLNTKVLDLHIVDSKCLGVKTSKGDIASDCVIITTGGCSYPSTGSTGDGYVFAKKSGHRIIEPTPALVPINLKSDWYKKLQGLSLRNVALNIKKGSKVVFSEVGEMLFAHFGVTGPLILKISSIYTLKQLKDMDILLDLRPGLTTMSLNDKILLGATENPNKTIGNILIGLFPRSMIPILLGLANIDEMLKGNQLSKEKRDIIVDMIKNLRLNIASFREFNEAIITRGGVSVKDVNPSTMESVKVQNLYFAGEVLDVDALTGGFNIQIAVSTGFIAGESAANS